MKFRTTILGAGKTAAGIEIPADVVESFGAGKRPPVLVTINGFTYRNTVAVLGGVYMIGVSATNRAGAGVAAGDVVDVDLELDTQPRVLDVPADLTAALDADADARRTFDAASYSNRQRIVLTIEDAKTDETRQRRVAKSVAALHEGRV